MKINEIFYSIQGEGPSIGQPAIFIRLAGCNQNCTFCDTKYHSIVDESSTPQTILDTLKKNPNCKRLIFTGGEPLLQQTEICEFLMSNYNALEDINIEFETNGTVEFNKYFKTIFDYFVVHFNVSPKFASSGNKEVEIFHKQFIERSYYSSIFKFVYVKGQVFEIFDFINENYIPKEKIYVMPEGATQKEQENLMPEVIEFCKKYGFTFSPRLHVLVWDSKKGV